LRVIFIMQLQFPDFPAKHLGLEIPHYNFQTEPPDFHIELPAFRIELIPTSRKDYPINQ